MQPKKKLLRKLAFCGIVADKNIPIKRLAKNGLTSIQLRRKNCSATIVSEKTNAIKKVARNYGIAVFVNDRVDSALASQADGVHIGKGDMSIKLVRKILGKRSIIGKTVRSVKEAVQSEREGADYVSVGPIFYTPFKKDISARGLALLRRVRKSIRIPVMAIGGINSSNIKDVLKTGVDGVGMIRGLRQFVN